MRIAVLVLAAAVMATAPAIAQTAPPLTPTPSASETTSEPPSSSSPAPTAEPGNDPQEEICRTVQRTESRLRSRRERLCLSRSQWEQMERDAGDVARGTGVNSRPSGG
jgi:hypothetical protein